MYLKSIPTAIVLAVTLLAVTATIGSGYIGSGTAIPVILCCIALALFYWAVLLHHKVITGIGTKDAVLSTMLWLALLMLIFPNLMMMVLLYGGNLAGVLAPVGMFMLLTVSLYYLLPYWIFGENLFLDETVISPHGMAGIWASVMIWTVVVIVAVALLNLVAWLISSTTNRGT